MENELDTTLSTLPKTSQWLARIYPNAYFFPFATPEESAGEIAEGGTIRETRKIKEVSNDEAQGWRDLYKAAMVELDPARVTERAASARTAMAQRLADLEKNRAATLEERWEILEAISSLEYWRRFNTD